MSDNKTNVEVSTKGTRKIFTKGCKTDTAPKAADIISQKNNQKKDEVKKN